MTKGTQKKQYPLDGKTQVGINLMGLMSTVDYYLYTAILMIFITDYSGIYAGIPGKAAAMATTLLFTGRVWDAFADLGAGYVIDRTPRTRWGKFKPYVFGGTFASGIFAIMLFNVPAAFSDFGKEVYMYILYYAMMLAFTVIVVVPLTTTLSDDQAIRSQLIAGPRITSNIVGVVFAFFIYIATFLGNGKQNIPLAVIVVVIPFWILSLIGIAMVKEGPAASKTEKPRLSDIGLIFRVNKPFRVATIITFIGGFVWAFITAVALYYIKYAFGIKQFPIQSSIYALLMLVTLVLGTLISQRMMKHMTAIRGVALSYGAMVPPLFLLWIANEIGLAHNPWIFYSLLAIVLTAAGVSFVPGTLMTMETMDYNRYKTGNGMEASINAITAFVAKMQAGLSSVGTGVALVVVGYNADVLEKATTIPESLLHSLGVVFFIIPAIVSLIATIGTRFYPLRGKEQEEMYAALKARKDAEEGAVQP
ncbi:MAG: MFS transporter [Schleiferilactobacillus harbinensis]|jgi:Na+/melibiose symporter-like transporter|uniref:MFS transporter n=1 Tax=Schleiferilactobacillus harbinensis TaxID=304207 RepID=UPI0039E78C5A